jgi:hypothetical protein
MEQTIKVQFDGYTHDGFQRWTGWLRHPEIGEYLETVRLMGYTKKEGRIVAKDIFEQLQAENN